MKSSEGKGTRYLTSEVPLLSREYSPRKLWSSQLGTQFLQLRREAWKIQDFNGVWTRDLAIPVRRSEATDVGSWSPSLIHSSRDH